MHSKIIQVSREPVTELITADDFLDGFVGWIADYTADVDSEIRNEIVKCFQKDMQNEFEGYVSIENDTITFEEGFRKHYDETTEQRLRKYLDMDIPFRNKSWFFRELINDEFGLYIYDDGLCTLGRWLSVIVGDGDTFYFGGVVDYHF